MNRRLLSSLAAAALVLISALMPLSASAQRGEKSVGLRGGFVTRNTTAVAGLYFSYRFTEHFRLAPKVDYLFRHHGTDAFGFNLDAEIPIALNVAKTVNFYPIGGLNYTTATTHRQFVDEDESIDSSQRTNHFGLNLGAGIEYFATPTLRLSFESKCLLVKQNTGGFFTVGIGYMF